MSGLSERRGFLRGIATLPLAGVLTAAGEEVRKFAELSSVQDPALTAAAAYRAAHASWRAAYAANSNGSEEDSAFDAKHHRLDDLYSAQAATLAGLQAQVTVFLEEDSDFLADGDGAHRGAPRDPAFRGRADDRGEPMTAARNVTQPSEYRALTLHDEVPAGCTLSPILDDSYIPHLKPGERAVIDLADRVPVSGELFAVLIGLKDRHVDIVQLRARMLKQRHDEKSPWVEEWMWWRTFGLPHPDATPAMDLMERFRRGYVRMADGPLCEENLRRVLVGRVVGVLAMAPL